MKNIKLIESLETQLQIKIQQIQQLNETHQMKLNQFKQPNNNNIQLLQQELREEREHYGPERIAKLEKMLFELQTNLAIKTQNISNLKDENRK